MEENRKQDFFNILSNAMKNNPVFSGLDDTQLEVFSQDFKKSFDLMIPSQNSPVGAWSRIWLQYQTEMTRFWLNAMSGSSEDMEASRDHRFKSESWNEGIFPFLRKSYEISAKAMADMADATGLPDQEQRKLSFYTRLMADSMAPSNYVLSNPDVLKLAHETRGQSLLDGFKNLLDDLGKGYISTTDETAFKVGENLATTAGSVIYTDDLVEIIHYEPRVAKVRSNPVVIIPPCVNKFYIFDINERKSMVKYLLDEGQNVIMLVWRNAGSQTGHYGWDEYLQKGIFKSLEVAADVTGSDSIDTMAWCNGGSMLLAALSVMPEDLKKKVATATFLSSMIDFSDPGEVQVFFDRPQMDAFSVRLNAENVAPGRDIANAMAMLHANESIWNFVISNYMLGKSPPPFDILYWNSDTANLPSVWYSYYIEEMYVGNKLKEPGGLTLLGKPVDTRSIDIPCYFVAASEDHIVPWKTSYDAISLVSGPAEFVLTPGGHVSGTVINHPDKNRRHFLTGGDRKGDAEAWRESASRTEGSWWPHWVKWLEENNPGKLQAKPKTLGNSAYAPLYPAPGKYVAEEVA